jgi:hypothetical protein
MADNSKAIEKPDRYLSSVPDPKVFGPSGSGSVSQRYGSGSGSKSFYHQAKKIEEKP